MEHLVWLKIVDSTTFTWCPSRIFPFPWDLFNVVPFHISITQLHFSWVFSQIPNNLTTTLQMNFQELVVNFFNQPIAPFRCPSTIVLRHFIYNFKHINLCLSIYMFILNLQASKANKLYVRFHWNSLLYSFIKKFNTSKF